MKTCIGCKEQKDEGEFYTRIKYGAPQLHARCKPCYNEAQAVWAANRVPVLVTEKICGSCKLVKPAEAFSRNRRARTGLQSYCRPCTYLDTRRRKYGLRPGELEAHEAEAAGRCQACKKERPLVLDHNHETGLFRGLLCTPCNLVLGHAADDPAVLRALAEYVER